MKGPTGIRYTRSSAAMTRRVGADTLVTMPADDAVHELSGGASAVWEELRNPRTVSDLVDRLAAAHGADAPAIAVEVEACIDTLVQLRVVDEVQDFDV